MLLIFFVAVWVVGLLTLVPYGTYYLFFEAQRDQYALLITGVLFWIFGYWGLVGPILMAVKVRSFFRMIERVRSREELLGIMSSADSRGTLIEMVASENRIPKFAAAYLVRFVTRRLARNQQDITNS